MMWNHHIYFEIEISYLTNTTDWLLIKLALAYQGKKAEFF